MKRNMTAKTTVRQWARPIALFTVMVWLVLAAFGGPFFGKISEVSTNDPASFLPKSAEATEVNTILKDFRDASAVPAIVVFESDKKLTKSQYKEIENIRSALQEEREVADEISPPIRSENKKSAFLLVPLDSETAFEETIPELQKTIAITNPSLDYKFTGPAMLSKDLENAFAGIDGILLVVALSVVFVILLVVYRSPILPIFTLVGAMAALATSIMVVWLLAEKNIVEVNGQVQGILFILVIGATTDYSLLYVARYREELVRHRDAWVATKTAWRATFEPILAAGGTVVLGLLCLLASDLSSNKSLGPVGGVGIVLAITSALTFLPGVLLLLGRMAFWPRPPKYSSSSVSTSTAKNHPFWHKVGEFVQRYPRPLWIGITAVLVVACLFVPQFKAEGVSQENLILGKSEAREGQQMLDRHFPSGSGSPAYVVTPKSVQKDVIRLLDGDNNVSSVQVVTTDKEITSMPVGEKRKEVLSDIRNEVIKERTKQLAEIRRNIEDQLAGAPSTIVDQVYKDAIQNVPSVNSIVNDISPFNDITPKVVNNEVLLEATLVHSASSVQAREAVKKLRSSIESMYPGVKIGGVSAIQLDVNTAGDRDLRIVIPLILLAITIVLMVLLRSIVAPLVLLATTVLSFGATIGLAAILFNNVWNFPGADPSVVIFGFVFLVALGIDYNIFLMTRVREETKKFGVEKGTLRALAVTGGVITSAGIVLAATFAALYVLPILFLAQIAFIVAFGVLLDTIIVRSLYVPSLTLEIGRIMWWPSKLWRKKK